MAGLSNSSQALHSPAVVVARAGGVVLGRRILMGLSVGGWPAMERMRGRSRKVGTSATLGAAWVGSVVRMRVRSSVGRDMRGLLVEGDGNAAGAGVRGGRAP